MYTKLLLDHHIHYIFEFFVFSSHFSVNSSEFAYQYRVLFVSSEFWRLKIVAESVCGVETSCRAVPRNALAQTQTSKFLFILESPEYLSLPIKAGNWIIIIILNRSFRVLYQFSCHCLYYTYQFHILNFITWWFIYRVKAKSQSAERNDNVPVTSTTLHHHQSEQQRRRIEDVVKLFVKFVYY